MSTGLFSSTISMGFYVSSLLATVVDKVTNKSWLRSDLNYGMYKGQQYNDPDDSDRELKISSDMILEDMEEKIRIEAKEGP
ncbi:hypothetical protein M0R45_007877 [Rubus argutus]|uniref:Uncharacterized protein n=1 Tax=Rubus argutus TaxID=59490 RepID=A0AAW1Y015_RUBAR